MYLQVTNRCNMTCRHCMFDCKRKGENFPPHQAYHAGCLAAGYDHPVTIGGGEPTLHPQLIEIIDQVYQAHPQRMFMVTNGSCTKRKWHKLLDRQGEGVIDIKVSWDPWHNLGLIQPWVESWASRHHNWWGDQRVVEREIILRGRAVKNQDKIIKDAERFGYPGVRFERQDPCNTPRITPDGFIFADMEEPTRMGWLGSEAYDRATRALDEYRERYEPDE